MSASDELWNDAMLATITDSEARVRLRIQLAMLDQIESAADAVHNAMMEIENAARRSS